MENYGIRYLCIPTPQRLSIFINREITYGRENLIVRSVLLDFRSEDEMEKDVTETRFATRRYTEKSPPSLPDVSIPDPFSVLDQDGNAVCCTPTIGRFRTTLASGPMLESA